MNHKLAPSHSSKKQKNNNNNLIAIDETQEQQDDIPYVELSGIPSMPTTTGIDIKDINNTLGTRVTHDTFQTYDSNQLLYDKLKLKIETFACDALWELPWKLIPFVFGLFIIVHFMDLLGFVDFLANQLINISNGSEWIAMFIVAFISTILWQCVNNQPMIFRHRMGYHLYFKINLLSGYSLKCKILIIINREK